MAIVHIAIDRRGQRLIARRYRSYTNISDASPDASMAAAIGAGGDTTRSWRCTPHRKRTAMSCLRPSSPRSRMGALRRMASASGWRAAAGDSRAPGPATARNIRKLLVGTEFITSDQPGKWRQDPISQLPFALGAHWGEVTPFVVRDVTRFRVPPPPAMTSREYTKAYNEVKRLGGDGVNTPTRRTEDQTNAAIYWAYDGTPSLCAPPDYTTRSPFRSPTKWTRHRRSGATACVDQRCDVGCGDGQLGVEVLLRYLAAGDRHPRGRPGDGPTSPATATRSPSAIAKFSPVGAPASNLLGPNFTPPFPAYPSGHAGFGGALFQTLRIFYRTDEIPFSFIPTSLTARLTRDNAGHVRPLLPGAA